MAVPPRARPRGHGASTRTFYVDEHNRALPHSAFRGQTLDETHFGTGDAVPAHLSHVRQLPGEPAGRPTARRPAWRAGRRRGRLTTGADRRPLRPERPASGRDDRTNPNAAIPRIYGLSRSGLGSQWLRSRCFSHREWLELTRKVQNVRRGDTSVAHQRRGPSRSKFCSSVGAVLYTRDSSSSRADGSFW